MRKLTAILFTDIVGFTRKMSDNERDTLEILSLNQKLHRKIVRKHHGRLVKAMGDGYLCTFDSSLQAVMAALQLQRSVNRLGRFELRIGIHVADVLFQGNDIYGEGVNLAARIESQAPGAGVWVSDRVAADLSNHTELNLRSIGQSELKGIDSPVEIFQVQPADLQYFGRTQAVRLKTTPWKRYFLLPFLLAIVCLAGWYGWQQWQHRQSQSLIVIAPFDYQGGADVGHLYLAEAFTKELASVLGETSDWHIISGNPAQDWLDDNSPLNMTKTAHLLDGTVTYLNERLVIELSLRQWPQQQPLWQKHYQGDINQLFQFQSEAAQAVLTTLATKP